MKASNNFTSFTEQLLRFLCENEKGNCHPGSHFWFYNFNRHQGTHHQNQTDPRYWLRDTELSNFFVQRNNIIGQIFSLSEMSVVCLDLTFKFCSYSFSVLERKPSMSHGAFLSRLILSWDIGSRPLKCEIQRAERRDSTNEQLQRGEERGRIFQYDVWTSRACCADKTEIIKALLKV